MTLFLKGSFFKLARFNENGAKRKKTLSVALRDMTSTIYERDLCDSLSVKKNFPPYY